MTAPKYGAQPWTCRDFDEDECAREMQDSVVEQFNTIYDCAFLGSDDESSGGGGSMLCTAHHSGDVRLFDWRKLCTAWLATRTREPPSLSWRAHAGAVYALAVLQHPDLGPLLATAADDGYVRLWRAADLKCVGAAAAAAAAAAAGCPSAAAAGAGGPNAAAGVASATSAPQLRSLTETQLPLVSNALGMTDGSQPAAQALATDGCRRLFVGGSDGGVHILVLAAGSPAVTSSSSSAVGRAELCSMAGHAAAVLCADYCVAAQCLATGSEDGTVRVWDCSGPGAAACVSILNPWEERSLPLNAPPAQLLECVRSSPVACCRYDAGGAWLLMGNAAGSLTLWNVVADSLARNKATPKCSPQALLLAPGAVYVAGTDGRVHQLSFTLESVASFEVGPESVYALRLEPRSGLLAACGTRGCLDILAPDGAPKGLVRPPACMLLAG